jgi:GntR family transcriptional regulator
MKINYDSKVPLYFQIKEDLKKKIQEGEYKNGDLLPSEKEFMERYDISSTTIRRALNDLVQEQYLERKAGKGTFVKFQKVKRNLKRIIGFTNNMLEMGLTPSTKVLSIKVLPANIFARERLGLKKGEEVFELKRLRLANDVPMLLETRYIRKDLCPDLEKHPLNSSLWNVFETQFGLRPMRHIQGMGVSTVSGEDARLLKLAEQTTVFLIRGVTFTHDNLPIECEESFYRADKYDLTFEAELE